MFDEDKILISAGEIVATHDKTDMYWYRAKVLQCDKSQVIVSGLILKSVWLHLSPWKLWLHVLLICIKNANTTGILTTFLLWWYSSLSPTSGCHWPQGILCMWPMQYTPFTRASNTSVLDMRGKSPIVYYFFLLKEAHSDSTGGESRSTHIYTAQATQSPPAARPFHYPQMCRRL